MKFKALPIISLSIVSLLFLPSCLNEEDQDYEEWQKQNDEYVAQAETLKDKDGSLYYERLTPVWAPEAFTLVHWHTDRSKTAGNLSPLDNSVCNVKYELLDIEENVIDSSYKSTTYGDSIYQTRPINNIIGFWNTLTQMHVGDSVTAVMPYSSAYGNVSYGGIKPYSTLIYRIKLVSIPRYEIPAK